MKLTSRISLLGLAFAALLATESVSQPAPPRIPAAIIAVIDNQRISRDAAAFKAARQQVDQYRSTYQAEFSREDERLRQEQQELERQRTLLAPEAFETRRREFETKVAAYQRRLQERTRALDQYINNTRNEVLKALSAVIQEMATERGYTIVLDKALTAYSVDALNITDEALRRLDRRLPVARVPAPGATQ